MNQDLNKIYDMTDFEKTFEKFIEETEFGLSVYELCYLKDLVGGLKESILRIKYSREPMQEVVMEYIPPKQMRELRDLVETYTEKLYEKVHKESQEY